MPNDKSGPGNNEKYFNLDYLKSDLKRRIIRGAGATVTSRILTYGIQTISTFILARILYPDDFGLVAMVTILSGILIEFGTLRLSDATIQQENITHAQVSTLFWVNFVLCSLLAILLIVISPAISWFYKEPRLTAISATIALAFVLSGLSVQHLALLTRNMEFHKIMINEVTATLVSSAAAIILAKLSWGYWSIVARQVIFSAMVAVGAWVLCPWRPGLPSRNTGVKPMIKFGLNSLGNYFTSYLSRNFEKVLIGRYFGSLMLGYYDRAYHLFVMPVNQLSYPLTNVAVSALSKMRNEPDKFLDYYLKALSMLAFIGMALSLLVTLAGKDIIYILLGSKWELSGTIFTVFGPGIGIMLLYGTHGWLHLSLGRADNWFRWGIFSFLVSAVSIIVGLSYGPVGVAIAYTSSFYILIGPGLWYAGKPVGLKIKIIVKACWKYAISALLSGLLSRMLVSGAFLKGMLDNVLPRMLFTMTVAMLLYILMVVVIHGSLQPLRRLFFIAREMAPNTTKS